jgi:Uncharacterised nucleotidyltransferase
MAESSQLWSAADELVDRARGPADLRAHGLHLLGAARLRALGHPVAEELLVEEWRAAMANLAVPALLLRARAAYDGQLMIMKGPEVALRYPDPVLRPFNDIDLLADDAGAAQRALLAAGFEEVGPHDGDPAAHDLPSLAWPGLPTTIEVHRAVHWVEGLEAPSPQELFDAAEPSRLGVAGLLAPAPHHHVLLLTAHAWAHEPLRRLVELVDVAAMSQDTDPAAVRALARQWRCARLWRSTQRAIDALLYDTSRSLALRTWARHLHDARERTVLESRLQRLAGPAWGLSARNVPWAVLCACAEHLRRHDHEPWRAKLARTGRLIRDAPLPISEHEGLDGPMSTRGTG